jgi:hypothetical protein
VKAAVGPNDCGYWRSHARRTSSGFVSAAPSVEGFSSTRWMRCQGNSSLTSGLLQRKAGVRRGCEAQLGALHAVRAERSIGPGEPIAIVMPTGTGKSPHRVAIRNGVVSLLHRGVVLRDSLRPDQSFHWF